MEPLAKQPSSETSFNLLPIEVWRHIFGYISHSLLLSPTAIHDLNPDKANTHSPGFARWDLFHTAHTCRSAYSAALPYLYSNLCLFFRNAPGPGLSKPPELSAPRTFEEVSQVMDSNYLHYRHFLFKEAAILPRICPCKVCDVQNERGDRVAEVTEYKHLAPYYVVKDGMLYLASLLSKEKEGTTEDGVREVLKQMWGPLASGEDPNVSVKILTESNLVLVAYPVHLVTSVAINVLDTKLVMSTAFPPSTNSSSSSFAWPSALAFLFSLPAPQIKSLSFLTRSAQSVNDLCQPLLNKYPFIEYVEVVANDPAEDAIYVQPHLGPRTTHVSLMLRAKSADWNSIPKRLLTWSNRHDHTRSTPRTLEEALRPPTFTANHRPMHHLAVRGNNNLHLEGAWEDALVHKSLDSLVLDFDSETQSVLRLPNMAHSNLRELTMRASLLCSLFHDLTIGVDEEEAEWPIMPRLQNLTIVPDMGFFVEGVPLGIPPFNIPPIPLKRLPGLRCLHVPAVFKTQRVMWTAGMPFIQSLFKDAHLTHVHVPLMLPTFNSSLPSLPQPNTALTSLSVNGLLLATLSNMDLPNLKTLTVDSLPMFTLVPTRWRPHINYLTVDFVHDRSLETWDEWWVHAARDLPKLVEFTVRKLTLIHEYSMAIPGAAVFTDLRALKVIAGFAHLDVSALTAPKLEALHLDVDHMAGFGELVAKLESTMRVRQFKLAGIACPTVLETLLSPEPVVGRAVGFKIAPVAQEVIAMGHGSAMVCECGGDVGKNKQDAAAAGESDGDASGVPESTVGTSDNGHGNHDWETDEDNDEDDDDEQWHDDGIVREHRLICQRTSMTLKYDPATNGYMWRALERDRRAGIAMTVVREKCDFLAELLTEEAFEKLSTCLLKRVNVIVPVDIGEEEARTVVRVVANVIWEHGGVNASVYSYSNVLTPQHVEGEEPEGVDLEGTDKLEAKETPEGPGRLVKEMEKIGVEVFKSAEYAGEWEGGEVKVGQCMTESDRVREKVRATGGVD